MVSMAGAAKIAVLLAVAALFVVAGADDQQAAKETGCWQCYSTCMHKCDGYPDAPVRTANRSEAGVHIAVDDGAAAASIDPVNYTDPTTDTVHSSDGAVAHVSDSYDDDKGDDKGDDEDEDEDEDDHDDDKDKGKGKDKDNDDDDDDGDDDDDDDKKKKKKNDDDDSNGKNYFTCKKKCIVDCYKDLPPVCYKMCVAESCLKLPPYKQGDCFKSCGHKCFHNHPPPPSPKPKPPSPKPKPPSPKPPTPKPPTPKPPTPKPAPPQTPPCPKRCPPKSKPKPKPKPPCPPAAKKGPGAKITHESIPCAAGHPGGCRPEQATNDTKNSNN